MLTQHRETTEAVLKKRAQEVEDIINEWRVEAKKESNKQLETQTLRIEQRLGDLQKKLYDRVERLDRFVESLRNAVLDDAN